MRSQIRAAAERYERAAAEMKQAEAEYAETLLQAYREGLSWSEVAETAGLRTGNQARLRAEHAMAPEELAPSRRRARSAGATPEGETTAPGLSVSDAAKELGVATSTVYQRIDRGELKATIDHLGRTRVLLDD